MQHDILMICTYHVTYAHARMHMHMNMNMHAHMHMHMHMLSHFDINILQCRLPESSVQIRITMPVSADDQIHQNDLVDGVPWPVVDELDIVGLHGFAMPDPYGIHKYTIQ